MASIKLLNIFCIAGIALQAYASHHGPLHGGLIGGVVPLKTGLFGGSGCAPIVPPCPPPVPCIPPRPCRPVIPCPPPVNPCAPTIGLPTFNKDAIWGALARKIGSKVQVVSSKAQVVGAKIGLKSAIKQTGVSKFTSLIPSNPSCPAPPCAHPCPPIGGPVVGPGPITAPGPVVNPLEAVVDAAANAAAEPTPV